MPRDYRKDLRIPEGGMPEMALMTLTGIPVAQGYTRCVFGARGPYIEFSHAQIRHDNLHTPEDKLWKINNPHVDYEELRTLDGVKVYCQKRKVSYADYQPGMYYISPFQLMSADRTRLIEEIRPSNYEPRQVRLMHP